MKKSLSIFLFLCFSCVVAQSQAQLAKIPASATAIVRYSGEIFSKDLPLEKLESYPFVRERLFKALNLDTLKTLSEMGIDFGKDVYQYTCTQDSVINFVTLFSLKDQAKFSKLLDANYEAEMKPQFKNGFQMLSLSAGNYVGWTNDVAVFVVSVYNNPNRYNYYDYETAASDTTVATMDAVTDTTVLITTDPDPVDIKPTKPQKKSSASKSKKGKSATKKKPVEKDVIPDPPVEDKTIIEEEVVSGDGDYKMSVEDSARKTKREAWQREHDRVTAERQARVAGAVLDRSFNVEPAPFDVKGSYSKVIDPTAHVSIWLDYDNLMQQYWLNTFTAMPYVFGIGRENYLPQKNEASFKTGVNVFFEKSQMRVEQRSFSPDESMTKLGKRLFRSKQSSSLSAFVNPQHIGYFSMSVNTEAMAHYYYRTAKQYLSNILYLNAYSDIVNVYIDFLEIMIDEEAMAELMPGNCMMVLHDIKTKKVSYTDYVYDDDFKATEVKKTKQELSPDFSFIIETEREDFMQKLVKLPVRYSRKGKFDYVDRGKYYELTIDSGNSVIGNMYFAVDKERLIITTSKASLDMALSGGAYPMKDETKKLISKNNYAVEFHTKKMLEKIGGELTTETNRKITTYLKDNLGDVQMRTAYRDGMIQSTTTMAISGNHVNSLQFFFNAFDEINKIMQKDKDADEQKFN